MEFKQVVINNIKVVGIFIIVSLISIPVLGLIWPWIEGKGDFRLSIFFAGVIAVAMLFLYFFGGRFFIKKSGILMQDLLSLIAIIIIVILVLKGHPDSFLFFAYPNLFLLTAFKNQDIGIQISVIASALMIIIGVITRTK